MKTNKDRWQSKTRLYRVWAGMWKRCTNPRDKCYRYYGGRGIQVALCWRSFERFKLWALAQGYRQGLTVDRKNGERGYTPANCRLATWSQQAQNRHYNSPLPVGVQLASKSGRYKFRKYRARIKLRGRERTLGYFDDPFSAAWVRDVYVQQYYDSLATLNHLSDRRVRRVKVHRDRRGTFDWAKVLDA
jgi:hypothetical protein